MTQDGNHLNTLKSPPLELYVKYHKLKQDSSFHRGFIIDESIVMEQVIDNILSNYFCIGEKVLEINEIVFNNEYISLGAKEKILQSTIEKYPEFKSKNKDLISDIIYIRKKRNDLAHLKLATTDKDIENYNGTDILYKKWSNGKEDNYLLTQEKKDKIVRVIENTINRLIEFESLVIKNKTPTSPKSQ